MRRTSEPLPSAPIRMVPDAVEPSVKVAMTPESVEAKEYSFLFHFGQLSGAPKAQAGYWVPERSDR